MARTLSHGSLLLRVVLGAALAMAAVTAQVSAQPPRDAPESDEWTYTVRPGDNLWTISRDYLRSVSDWQRLQSRNRIANPYQLQPGTYLRIPFSWMKTEPAPASAVETRGTVELTRAGSTQPLPAGTAIRPGDVITTGKDGSLAVEFADGSRLQLESDSRVVFDVLSAFGRSGMVDTRVRLERGRANARVAPRRGRFRIWTPAAATVVRGTEFRAEFDEASDMARAETTAGLVAVVTSDAAVAVQEGFGSFVRQGEVPSAPVRLLAPPDLGSGPLVVRSLPVKLAVASLSGAVSYRLDVASDDQFQTLVLQANSTTGTFATSALADGTYSLRVRGIDEHGLQGMDAVSRLIVDARPEPPVAMAPQAGATVGDERPGFSWSRPAGASGFRFQLAREETRDTPIVDVVETTWAPAFTPANPVPPGEYAWRVATRAADGEVGPFGQWQTFTRRQRAPGPPPGQRREEAGRLWLGWPAGLEASRFRVQLARDAGFSDVVIDRVVDTPELGLERPSPGTYHLRIRTIESDGFEGDFGPAQSFEVLAPPPPSKKRSWTEFILPAVTVIVSFLAL
jgi:hypothetical protein